MAVGGALDFANALAALNCTAIGARGGIRGREDAVALMNRAERRSHADFATRSTH
jgi:sulfofructose kinase